MRRLVHPGDVFLHPVDDLTFVVESVNGYSRLSSTGDLATREWVQTEASCRCVPSGMRHTIKTRRLLSSEFERVGNVNHTEVIA